jgi:hypothetical protein
VPPSGKDKPLLWKAFDAAERVVAPRLEQTIQSGAFLDALGLATRAQARMKRDIEARSRRLWHLVNLPAGSDVTHLRRQVAQLDRELRRLSAVLEQAQAQPDRQEEDDHAARTRGSAGPRSAGRRAQRAEGP